MWVVYAFAGAFFAGFTSILAKIGIKNIDSNLATAIRTVVILCFSWLMVFLVGSQKTITEIDSKSLLFLVLSGCATGGSWLCYFKALQIGDVNKVIPIDKSSTVLTMLLAFIFLGENFTLVKALCMLLIACGTYMMIDLKPAAGKSVVGKSWLVFALLSAFFASLTAILAKIGIEGVESNLGTAIRTAVVLLLAWGIVLGQGTQRQIKDISKKSWLFLILSGFATGFSWLFFYRALQQGPASVVVPIDKLSILVSIAFAYFIFNERLNKKTALGLLMIVIGTLSLLL